MFADIVESEFFFNGSEGQIGLNVAETDFEKVNENVGEIKCQRNIFMHRNPNSPCHFLNVFTTKHSGSGVNPRLANQCGQVHGLMRRLTQGAGCAQGIEP